MPSARFILRRLCAFGVALAVLPGCADKKDPPKPVEKYAILPPGAREYDRFDVQVSALKESNTTSLAHGLLWRTELKRNGANTIDPAYAVDIPAVGEGYAFVNPVYASQSQAKTGSIAARDSL